MIDKEYLLKLINKIKEGDDSAFEEFINQTNKSVFSFAFKMLGNKNDAQDVCQEVYLKIFRYLKSYNVDKEFNYWFYKIILNCCLNFIKYKQIVYDPAENIDLIIPSICLEENYSDKQLIIKAFEFLKKLTPQERAVFILRDVKNLTSKEISKILGCTQITVRRHSNNARKKLKEFLALNK